MMQEILPFCRIYDEDEKELIHMLFKEYIEEFRRVVKLSRDHRISYEKYSANNTISQELQNIKNEVLSGQKSLIWRKEKALEDYLMQLDFEIIKILQTIMYLGRDKDYSNRDSPKDIYLEQRRYFDNEGWTTKEIEINQMTEKLPLDQYLEEGFKILNIPL
jgi:hypothetical protein